jgi:hypothetical protein
LPGVACTWPKSKKILGQRGIGDESSHIGEGETGSTFHDMTPLRVGLDAIGVDPGDGSGHHTEVQVIDHRMGVTCLAPSAADLLFDFLEAGFDLPTRTVVFDDLLDRERQVGSIGRIKALSEEVLSD